MSNRNQRQATFQYLFAAHFESNADRVAEATGHSKQHVTSWINGAAPQARILDRMCSIVFAPEFRIVCEYQEIAQGKNLRKSIASVFNRHHRDSSIYAFYDTRVQLLYVGKAKELLREACQALGRHLNLAFPKGFPDQDLVRYVSAYNVKHIDRIDHAKHIESLILRISKPPINMNIEQLESAHPSKNQ